MRLHDVGLILVGGFLIGYTVAMPLIIMFWEG